MCWLFVIECLKNNYFYLDPFIQEIINYCEPLKEQNAFIKFNIMNYLNEIESNSHKIVYNKILKNNNIKPYLNSENIQNKYNILIKNFLENDFDFKVDFNKNS